MELRRDLLKISEKSWRRISFGAGFLLLAIAWMVDRYIEFHDVRAFDWLYSGFFVFSGIIHIVEGFGYSFSALFGNAFLLIDKDVIHLKTGLLEKEQRIQWKEVAFIDYHPAIFRIIKVDQKTENLKVTGLNYALIQEIKEVIRGLAIEKGISISF